MLTKRHMLQTLVLCFPLLSFSIVFGFFFFSRSPLGQQARQGRFAHQSIGLIKQSMTAAPSGAQDYPGVKLRGLPLVLSPPAFSENGQCYIIAESFL